MRAVLIALLIHGLVPALGEIAEAAVHYAVEGHLAHTDADQGDLGDPGHEHGCGTSQHLCGCCASQVAATPPAVAVVGLAIFEPGLLPSGSSLASIHEPAPPYRPPIAS